MPESVMHSPRHSIAGRSVGSNLAPFRRCPRASLDDDVSRRV